MLLLQDGHASHISIEFIESARANHACLRIQPMYRNHWMYVLEPLDVGVFKSFITHFSKACHAYLAQYPGRVITTDVLASLVAEAWPQSLTSLNILSGLRKCGICPINPGAVSDHQLPPFKAVKVPRTPPPPLAVLSSHQTCTNTDTKKAMTSLCGVVEDQPSRVSRQCPWF